MDQSNQTMADYLHQNQALLEQMVHSADARRLMELLNQNAGGALKSAASSAALGDPTALLGMVRQVMQTQEGAKLVERLNQTAPKQP